MSNHDKNANSENEYVEADYTEFIAAPHTEVLVEPNYLRKTILYALYTILGLITLTVLVIVFRGIHKEILQQEEPEPYVSHKIEPAEQEEEPSAIQTEKTNTEDKCSRRLVGHKKLVNAIAFSPDGRYVISGEGAVHYDSVSDDYDSNQNEPQKKTIYYLYVWNYRLNKPERMLDEHRSPISAVAYSQDGLRAASADISGNFVIWNATTWTIIDKFTPAARTNKGMEKVLSINSLAFSPDGTTLAAGGSVQPYQSSVGDKNSSNRKGCVILWDLNAHHEVIQNEDNVTPQPIYNFTTETDCIFSLAYSRMAKPLIIAGASGANAGVYVLDNNGNITLAIDKTTKRNSLSTGLTQYSSGHNNPPSRYLKATLRYDNRCIAAGDNEGRISLWEFQGELSGTDRIQAMDFLNKQGSLDGNIRDIKFSYDGKYLVTCGDEVAIWNGESDSLSLIGYLSPHVDSYQARLYYGYSLAFTPDGESVAVACSDKVIRIWDFKQFSTILRRITPVEKAEKSKNYNTRFDGQTIETPADLDFRSPKKKNDL